MCCDKGCVLGVLGLKLVVQGSLEDIWLRRGFL